jgi:hypothetical protein
VIEILSSSEEGEPRNDQEDDQNDFYNDDQGTINGDQAEDDDGDQGSAEEVEPTEQAESNVNRSPQNVETAERGVSQSPGLPMIPPPISGETSFTENGREQGDEQDEELIPASTAPTATMSMADTAEGNVYEGESDKGVPGKVVSQAGLHTIFPQSPMPSNNLLAEQPQSPPTYDTPPGESSLAVHYNNQADVSSEEAKGFPGMGATGQDAIDWMADDNRLEEDVIILADDGGRQAGSAGPDAAMRSPSPVAFGSSTAPEAADMLEAMEVDGPPNDEVSEFLEMDEEMGFEERYIQKRSLSVESEATAQSAELPQPLVQPGPERDTTNLERRAPSPAASEDLLVLDDVAAQPNTATAPSDVVAAPFEGETPEGEIELLDEIIAKQPDVDTAVSSHSRVKDTLTGSRLYQYTIRYH